MRILLVSQGFSKKAKEATGITLMLLAGYLRRRGHETAIISGGKDWPGGLRKMRAGGIDVYRFGTSGRKGPVSMFRDFIWSYRRAAKKAVREKKYDVVHGFSSSPALCLRTLAVSRIFGNAARIHTIKSYSKSAAGRAGILALLLNTMDFVTIPSQIMKNWLVSCGLSASKAKIIRSPINAKRFRPGDRQALKRKHGYSNRRIILYYGATSLNKGVHVLIKAMPDVVRRFPDSLFIYAPRYAGEETDERISLAEKTGLRANFRFITSDIDIAEYVAMADLVVLPYTTIVGTEGNPSCLLEGAASKTPVVTTELPELKEIMKKGDEILMAAPGDHGSLSKNIARALSDSRLRKRLAENAYSKVRQFSIEEVGEKFISLYKDAAEARRLRLLRKNKR